MFMYDERDRVAELGDSSTYQTSESSYKQACLWKDGSMVLRWVASALIATEKSFRRIMGHEQLWMLKSQLDNPAESKGVARQRKTG